MQVSIYLFNFKKINVYCFWSSLLSRGLLFFFSWQTQKHQWTWLLWNNYEVRVCKNKYLSNYFAIAAVFSATENIYRVIHLQRAYLWKLKITVIRYSFPSLSHKYFDPVNSAQLRNDATWKNRKKYVWVHMRSFNEKQF